MSDVSLRCILAGSAQEPFVASGWLRLRQRGPWFAFLECSGKVAPAELSAATLVLRREDKSEDLFVGAVRRAKANPSNEKLVVSLVGGAGKLITPLRTVDHVLGAAEVPAGVVARAICDDAGEQLAPGVELALDARTLPRWHRATDITAAVALDLLAAELGYVWRVLPSGLVWIGAETWPTGAAGAAYWTGLDEDDGAVLYATRGAPLAVGQAIDGLQAIDVRYTMTSSTLAVEVRGAVSGDPPHLPDLDLYRGSYAATAVAQNADGTLDVRCDDARIGELRSLVLRIGIPGARVTVDTTTSPPPRVRVRFHGASPKGAYAEGLDQDGAATAAVALVGDGVGGAGGGALLLSVGAQTLTLVPVGTPLSVPLSVLGPGSLRVKLR